MMRILTCSLLLVCVAVGEQHWLVEPTNEVRYPPLARMTGTRGRVRMRCDVAALSTVAKCTAVSGPALLKRATIDQIKDWRFRQNPQSKKASGKIILQFEFVLDDSCNFEERFTFQAPNRARIVAPRPCRLID